MPELNMTTNYSATSGSINIQVSSWKIKYKKISLNSKLHEYGEGISQQNLSKWHYEYRDAKGVHESIKIS